jgi:hypothetical protein
MRKLSWFSYPMPDTVQFTQRELARLAGRNSFGGSDQADFYNAIQQLRSTRVSYWHYTKQTDEWTNHNIQILDTDIWSGREHQITRCSVQLHQSIVESLNNRHAMCLNYARMEQLSPIGIALFKRLFFHFSNLYSLKRTKDFTYTKNYASICRVEPMVTHPAPPQTRTCAMNACGSSGKAFCYPYRSAVGVW